MTIQNPEIMNHFTPSFKFSFPIEMDLMKRMMDVGIATLALILLSPIFLLVILLLKITSPGPIFYKSLRVGKDYKPFHMFKFRTMHVNADTQRDALREQNSLQGQLFKIKNDPRITPVGKFLRAFSIDELPQIFNVLQGEMSIVGPRPLPPDESVLFEGPYIVRFSVFPGITGAWQVGGRSDSDFQRLCQLEFRYIQNWSLWEDVRIIFQTIPAVFAKSGAY